MSATFTLTDALRDQVWREARAAFPRECCGLIEGARTGGAVRATTLHPARNLAEAADRFEIDPAAQFRLLRALRGTGREIVGCYHSHPDGRAEPSERDRENAGEEGFIWLLAALATRDDAARLAAFSWQNANFVPVALIQA